MTIINPGELWVADIPFTNGASSKKRPVLVLWLDGQDAMVAVVTSAQPRTPMDGCIS
jgi:mRNA interferase MazF